MCVRRGDSRTVISRWELSIIILLVRPNWHCIVRWQLVDSWLTGVLLRY